MQEFPKVVYRTVDGKPESRRVESAEAERALKGKWFEHPGCDAPAPVAPATEEAEPETAPEAPKAHKKSRKQ